MFPSIASAAFEVGEEEEGFSRCSSSRFPETLAERKSMAVFEDLWAKGLCAVSGSNYGADYVVYDGASEVWLLIF